jgi:THO complex subunit 1
MAISGISPANSLAARLTELLDRAREVKKSTTVDPPLQVSELASDGEDIIGPITGDREIHMNAIETAAKQIFYSKLVGPEHIRSE